MINKIILFFGLLSLLSCHKEMDRSKPSSLSLSFVESGTFYSFEGNEQVGVLAVDSLKFKSKQYSLSNTLSDSANLFYSTSCGYYVGSDAYLMDFYFTIREDKKHLYEDSLDWHYSDFDSFKNNFEVGDLGFKDFDEIGFGINISLVGATDIWSSSQNVTNHSNYYNSKFVITEIENYYSYEHDKMGLRIFADFDITLYNANSDSLRLEDGSLVMLVTP